jgi:DegV family protein with EDD domain
LAVQVVTDTTQYLPSAVVEAEGIHLVSLYVRFGDELQRESELGDFEAFYERLRTAKDLPTTSQPSVGDFLAVWEPLIDAGDDVVSIHLSAGISGTYDSALQARAQLEERGLGGKVEVSTPSTTCGGQAMLVLAAAAKARGGAGLNEVVRHGARRASS